MQKRHMLHKASGLVMGSSMLLLSLLPGASAFAATGAPSVTLTGSSITSTVGGTVTYTAAASNISNPEYQFWVEEPNGQWVEGTSWQSSPTFTLTTSQSGDYLVSVNALSASQVKAGDWAATVSPANGSDGVFVNSSVSLTGNTMDVAVGQKITVTATASNIYDPQYQFWWQNPVTGTWHGTNYMAANNANGSYTFSFNAPVAGSYRMIAYAKSPLAVNDLEGAIWSNVLTGIAYGAPAMVNLSPATSSVAADGAATDSLTATVVDANGNTVLNYNGTVGVVLTNPDLTPTNALNGNTAGNTAQNPYWFQATNGIATISLQELSSVGSSNIGDTETITPILPSGMLEANDSATVSLTAPQPTYDVLAQYGDNGFTGPIPSVMVNTNNHMYLGAFVADQNQVPMPIGYGEGDAGLVTVHVSGPATLTYYNEYGDETVSGLTSATLPIGVYSGDYYEYLQLVPNPNANGTVTLTLSNPTNGLQVGSPIQVQIVPPQTATSWSVTSSTSTTFTADEVVADTYAKNTVSESGNVWTSTGSGDYTSPQYTIQAQDSNGLAEDAQQPSFAVSTASGQAVSNLVVTGVTSTGVGAYGFNLEYLGGPLAAGTYNVTVTEGLMQTLTIPITITTGQPYEIGVTPNYQTAAGGTNVVDVTATNPSITVTGQVEDALGNPVAAPGAQLTFSASDPRALSVSGGAVNSTNDSATVYVNSAGAASVTASALAEGSDGYLTVTGNLANDAMTANGTTSLLENDSATVDETQAVVSQIVGTVTGNDYVAGSNYTSAAPFPEVLVTEENAAHSPLSTGDTLNYSITSTNPFFTPVQGSLTYSGTNTPIWVGESQTSPGNNMAGTYTVKVSDASNSAVAPITETVTIDPGAADGVGLFSNGSEVAQDVSTLSLQNDAYNTNYDVPMTGSIQTTANSTVPVWVHVTDATGNIVNAPAGGLTVSLSMPGYTGTTAAFENAAGDVISSVTIPAGTNGVEVYLADSKSESVPVMAMYDVVPTASFAGTTKGAATVTTNTSGGYNYTWTVDVTDQFGNGITNLKVADFGLVDTSTNPPTTYTGTSTLASGMFTVSPVSGQPGEYTITANYNGSELPTTDVAQITADGDTINGTF